MSAPKRSVPTKKYYGWKQDGGKARQTVLNKCPTANECCYSLPPKVATFIIAIFGLLLSSCYIYFFFVGKELILPNIGIRGDPAQFILHTYAVVGILFFSVNFILLIAVIKYIQALILLYLWTVILYSGVDIVTIFYIAYTTIGGKYMIYGICVCICDIIFWTIVYVFVFPVVNGFRRSIQTILIVLT